MGIKIKGLQEALDFIQKTSDSLSDAFYADLGKTVADRIRQKARTGKTMATGVEADLKPLSKSYIDFRKDIDGVAKQTAKGLRGKVGIETEKLNASHKAKGRAAVGVDPDFFSPSRSNLTLSGQYLKSIALVKVDKSKHTFTVAATGTRTKTASFLGHLKGSSTPTNAQISEWQGNQGRSIWGLDATGKAVLKQKVVAELRRLLKQK